METDGGWISISEASRLYQKDRKWVSNQINAYNLETRKRGKSETVTANRSHSAPGRACLVMGQARYWDSHWKSPQKVAPALPRMKFHNS